jgi:hypothetical protein
LERIRAEPFILRTSSYVVFSHVLDRGGNPVETGIRNDPPAISPNTH